MTTFTNFSTKHQALLDETALFSADIAPLLERFVSFFNNNDGKYRPFYELDNGENLPASAFKVDLSPKGQDESGVTFCCPGDGDDYEYRFVMPYAYLENPDAWESDIIQKNQEAVEFMTAKFEEIAPGMIAKYNLELTIEHIYTRSMWAHVQEAGREWKRFGLSLDGVPTNSFGYDKETGELTYDNNNARK